MFDLIIFDCDGTLTDSEYVNNRALLEVLHEVGFTQYDLDYAYTHWVGTTVTGICLSVQMETGREMPADIVPRYIKRVAELQRTSLRPVEGAPELVAAAKEVFEICVASNGERENVLCSLRLTGLMHNFTPETVFTKIQVRNPKPYPDLYLYAAAQMGFEPERCLVIEDSAAGVQAGIAAGMTTWGFSGSAHDPLKQAETLKLAGAQRVFDRLIHIREKLGL
ncbi:MAG TPA: HAD family hydrolase [Micavibrio sp.]|nr:HAD family hydrolase [Micavibrio sp.]